ncbi:butyrophilin subfamily 1 member A1-like [Lepus europaeus]|uniref:butyrophilin subfamily 1 member A1-like n=1 Tax=Lepus europaeus TaxID=9983 RepID=UPI002B4853D4|nr:butyrophilin subfamily 1 member A1-like [Lepus europaeus]
MASPLHVSTPTELLSILLLQAAIWGSDSFTVSGPSEPIVAMLGTETVLPCHVVPPMNVETMELRWFRSQYSEVVYAYRDGMEQVAEQLVDFKGRAELVKDYISEGKVAVRIRSLRVSDNGMYKCFFKRDKDFEEATLELKIISLGSGPHILMVGPEDEGIRLMCTGKGWFPQPEIQWKGEGGEKLPSLSEDETQDDDGLFQIEASIIIRDRSKRDVSCSMKNPFFLQEQVETISIPEPFFPRTSPWRAAFAVTFFMLVICLGAVVFLAWKEKQAKKRVQNAEDERKTDRQAKEKLEKELATRKELYQHDWTKANLYADWRKEYFKAVDVSLDKNTAHRGLTISGDGKRVSLKKNVVQNSDAPPPQGPGGSGTIFSAVGQNCFATGRCYWEVKVLGEKEMGQGAQWTLGICPETVNRERWFVENTENNLWLVAYKEGKVMTLTSKPESLKLRSYPERIGVFLDWEAGDLSFYNMVDGSHICSYTGINFCGKFQPYFSLQGAGTSMTICSASGQTENVPSSSAETSVTHVRNCDTDVPQETNTLLSP